MWEMFHNIVGEAERASATTGERCGESGVRHEYWLETLCASCAEPLGYVPVPPRRETERLG